MHCEVCPPIFVVLLKMEIILFPVNKVKLFFLNIQHLSMVTFLSKNINKPQLSLKSNQSLNYKFKVLCDTVLSAHTLSHATFSLKYTLAVSLIYTSIRMCHPICHKIQYTKTIVSVSKRLVFVSSQL